MKDKPALGPLTFGFDIGIASVGWAVLNSRRIVALGVRAFDVAENPKTGAPLNEHRRLMRTARNRLKRRALRLKRLRRVLRDAGILPSADISALVAPDASSPWDLRARGLDVKLEPSDWARAIYHLAKHRGFFAARRSEVLDQERERGKLSQGVQRTTDLMKDRWRTPGEMAARDEAFAKQKRNKAGSYANTFDRRLICDELRLLFARQRELGNNFAGERLEEQVWKLLNLQRAPLTGTAMLEMIGTCTFEKDEYRAPKRSWSAERFIWLSKLNTVRIVGNGARRALTEAERQMALDLPYKFSKVTFKQLRKAIGLEDASDAGFAGLSYGSKRNRKGEPVDPEGATLVELKGWHALRKGLEDVGLKHSWQRISTDRPTQDAIALALSIYKSDEELRPELAKLGLDAAEVDALLAVDFREFIQLSQKALTKILPHLEIGLRYDEACVKAGYDHARPSTGTPRSKTLPPLGYREIRNPVVFRALGQARKVLNGLVRAYGSPCAVHIELARDLSKSWEERMDIRKGQEAYRDARIEAQTLFEETFGRKPIGKNRELEKFRLYGEQGGKCAYSLEALDIDRVVNDPTYVEIDHALPYSRSFDDSQNNRVLVLCRENQNKGNRTPYEYLDGANDSERWRQFQAWVRGQKNFRKAKRDRLLRVNFGSDEAEEFKQRNLNDTRYIARFFADFVRQYLAFGPDESGIVKKVPVVCPAGSFTGFVRARWGLTKHRENGDLHHALDACVIAAASPALIKRISDFSRRAELVHLKDGTFADKQSGEVISADTAASLGEQFPQPWPMFREEVIARLSPEPRVSIDGRFPAYDIDVLAALRPVLVSRAVKRRAGGAIHEDTVRSVAKHLGANTSARRIRLENLKLTDLLNIVGADDPRNAGLLAALRERLEAHKGDGKKAFGLNAAPVYKPRKDGTPGPVIRAVKVKSPQSGGVPVRGGVADQASMWRVDVFRKGGRYFLVPLYQADRKRGQPLPDHACVAHKPRSEWDRIDDSFDFRFSLYPNDLIRVKQRGKTFFGYFAGADIASANIDILVHDRNPSISKNGVWRGVGIKVGVEDFTKFHVDILGNSHTAQEETRRGLA
jgi:CRISPR-associated endonuclease Csn1